MDVAIIGTGISGITLAVRLQQLGMETTRRELAKV
jgi:cation diffusion facilitator CzcD-associated flavoprotein CzcO